MRASEALKIEQERELQNRTQENGAARELLIDIKVTKPEPFIGIAKVKYLTSTEISKLVAVLFNSVYSDYYGSKVEVDPQTRIASLSMFFSHLQFNENDVTAFSPKADVQRVNDVVRRLANQRINATEGRSSYMITSYGKDGLGKFISPRFKDKSGTPHWNQIHADVNNGSGTGFNNTMILSQLRGLDLSILFATIFGSVNEDGDEVEYSAEINSTLPTGEFLFAVTRINKSELDRTIRAAGITNTNSLGVVTM